ncbi:MAG: discoidin domain-containing protein [Candidatus Aminicenantes bacterium]|nr:discoidin domain-containing protein [Candidatus Aminicenantes bacterium]
MKTLAGSLALLVLGLAVLAPAAAAQDPGKEVLQIQLPKPMFVGTPKNIRTPNLETVTGRPRGPFMVPAGTTLLSAGKPVSASDKEPVIGEIAFVTDGKKSGEDGYYVEFGPMLQWVQIDLGKSQDLQAIVCWHYHSQARVYRDVIVQVSDDKDFISGVTTVFNNDHDNTAGLGAGRDKEYIETFDGKLFDPKGVKARYVRLTSAGNTSTDMNHYVEVEVYGLPAK